MLNDLLFGPAEDPEPLPDIAKCGNCGWEGHPSDCDTEEDGDWESGHYDVHICPKCRSVWIEYDMSPEQGGKWNEWQERKTK
jgi:hypothetical protein